MLNIAVKLGAVGSGILGLIGATVYLIEQGQGFGLFYFFSLSQLSF